MAPELVAGRYAVLRAVGRGGMGTVWLCRDEVLGREVALKQVGLLPGESVPDLARALREARLSAALNHPHVVSVFDTVEEEGRIWLVMEHVPGETLAELVAREGRLAPQRVAAIGAQVAEGLLAAHSHGTVHRDVKPGNVLVAGDTAKISDFGIARARGEDQLTRSGQVMGTPLYFSPELARGADPSPAADVWALGATLYTAVEGRPPVAARGSAIATLAAIAETRPAAPEHADFLAEPLGRMLDPDPASRWSMADAAHALRQALEAHRPPGTLAMTGDADRADRPRATSTAGGGPALRNRRRSRGPVLLAVLLVLLLSAVAGAVLLGRDPSGPSSGAGSGARSPSADSPSASATSSPSPSASATSPTPSPSSSPSPPSSSPSSPTAPPGRARSVADYYALLPGDTRTAWTMLGEEARAQAGGYDRYVGFWRSVDDVSTDTVSTEGDVVTVHLTYTSDGDSSDETRQLEVRRDGAGWLIAEDLGPVGG